MHPLAVYLMFFPLAVQADVYKCLDTAGKVTYTNSPCAQSGLKEAGVIPPPPVPAARTGSRPAEKPVPGLGHPAALQLTMVAPGNACTRLYTAMGKITDEMDTPSGREAGPEKQTAWKEELNRLQDKKNRLGCF